MPILTRLAMQVLAVIRMAGLWEAMTPFGRSNDPEDRLIIRRIEIFEGEECRKWPEDIFAFNS